MIELAIGQRVRSLRLGDETIEGTVVSGVQGHDDMVIVAWDMPRESYEARSDLVAAATRPTPDAEAMEREFVGALRQHQAIVRLERHGHVSPDRLRSSEQDLIDLYRKAVSR